MAWDYDYDKAQLFFIHALKASHKFHQRRASRDDLIRHLQDLKKINLSGDVQAHIAQLEHKIADLVAKERSIIKAQQADDLFRKQMKDQLAAVEAKLHSTQNSIEQKHERYKALESKVTQSLPRNEQLKVLGGQIKGLESLYQRFKKEGTYSAKELQRVAERITALKDKLKKESKKK